MTLIAPLLLLASPAPTLASADADTDVYVRADFDDPDSALVGTAIEESLSAEGISVRHATMTDDSARLATVDIRVDDERVSIRIDDAGSDASMERFIPTARPVSTVVAQETAYVVRAAAVSLREHGTLDGPAPSTDPAPTSEPVGAAPPPEEDPTPARPAVGPVEPSAPKPDPAFPRGGFIQSQAGPGVQAWGRHSPLPTLDSAVTAGWEFGRAGRRDDLRIALGLNLAHDERFSVPATWRGGVRGPLGLYSQWDFMPQLRIGRVFGKFMPYVSLAVGPGVQTNNDTQSDRFMMTGTASGGAMWQVVSDGMQSKLGVGLEVGARGSLDPIHPETQSLRAYAALKIALYFGRRD